MTQIQVWARTLTVRKCALFQTRYPGEIGQWPLSEEVLPPPKTRLFPRPRLLLAWHDAIGQNPKKVQFREATCLLQRLKMNVFWNVFVIIEWSGTKWAWRLTKQISENIDFSHWGNRTLIYWNIFPFLAHCANDVLVHTSFALKPGFSWTMGAGCFLQMLQ